MQKLMSGLYIMAIMMSIFSDPSSAEATEELLVDIENVGDGTVSIGIQWPISFTDTLEIYSATNLILGNWEFAYTNIGTSLSNSFAWVDLNTNSASTFYVACNADLDEDGDGLVSAREKYIYKTDSLNPDSDVDGMDDGWEVAYGFDPLTDDADGDADGDGLTNAEEYVLGSDPDRDVEITGTAPFNVVFYQPTGGA